MTISPRILKLLRLLYFTSIALITVIACFYINIWAALFGLILGLLFYSSAYMYKFWGKKEDIRKIDSEMIIMFCYQAFAILSIAYFNYAMVYLHRDGIEKRGVVTKTDSIASMNANNMPVTDYYCWVSGYNGRISCRKSIKTGDTLYYLYSPQLPNTYPILYKTPKGRLTIIIEHGGSVFLGTIIFLFSLLSVWLFSIFRTGLPQLQKKIEQEKEKERKAEQEKGVSPEASKAKKRWGIVILQHFSYVVSFVVFSLFILALLKNLYINIPFKFWSIGLTSITLIIILITNWGEKIFELSNNIILSLRHYRILSYLKQAIKILAYISFGIILYESLVLQSKSFPDACVDFFNKYFDINLKTIRDFFDF